MTDNHKALVERIGKLLASDPICMGRVTQGTVEAIAAETLAQARAALSQQKNG